MPYTALKILAYLLAWSLPVVLIYRASRRWLILVFLIPFAWLLGLGCASLGHFFHQAAWLQAHPGGSQTEDDMAALGDYPNVFVLWVLAGWIPVVIGLILARRAGCTKRGV